MGYRTCTVAYSLLESTIWQQPGPDVAVSKAVIAEGLLNKLAEATPLTATDLAASQAPSLAAAGSSDGSTGATEEESALGMHIKCIDIEDDDYVLVAAESPQPLSKSLAKEQGALNK